MGFLDILEKLLPQRKSDEPLDLQRLQAQEIEMKQTAQEKEIAVLKAQIEAANESQKKILSILGPCCATLIATAVLLVGRSPTWSGKGARDKAALRYGCHQNERWLLRVTGRPRVKF
jgi:hypothetical protein